MNATFFRVLLQLVNCSYFWTLFKHLSKTVSKFPQFFPNFIKFVHSFSTVSLRSFKIFVELIRTYPVIFLKLLQKSLKSSWNFRKIFPSMYIKIQCFSARYFKKSELLNRLRSFMDQFVCYIHGKICSLYSI